jgi:hypothetical protein
MLPKTLIICLIAFSACKAQRTTSLPQFVTNKIAEIKSHPRTNPGKSIWQYEYKGKIVYFIPLVCCDIPSYLYDEKGNLICYPDGGFTGQGDGKCADFIKTKTNGKLIWKDDRH